MLFKTILKEVTKWVLVGFCFAILVNCATITPDYSVIDTHKKIVEKNEYPHMVLPNEFDKNLDHMKLSGYNLIGSVVDNYGNALLFFEEVANGTCHGLLVSPNGSTQGMSCDVAMKMYEQVCVKENLCTDNPYDKNRVSK